MRRIGTAAIVFAGIGLAASHKKSLTWAAPRTNVEAGRKRAANTAR